MRLRVVGHGHTLKQKAILLLMRVMTGFRAPDVVRTLFYRRSFWGTAHGALTQLSMRGPSKWSIGDRELFAAYVSRLNQCVF
jgi:hypothetical protein